MRYAFLRTSKSLVATIAVLVSLAAGGVAVTRSGKRITAGKWNGNHVNLTVTPEGLDFEFDCASGSAKGQPSLDCNHKFKLSGTYASQSGSSSAPGESRPAEYSGSVKDKSMTLEVRFTDTNLLVGTYQLGFGPHRRLNKCPVSRP